MNTDSNANVINDNPIDANVINDNPINANLINENQSPMMQEHYIAIDLKSFYASVECRERGLDPLNTNLVVADASRTEKTICLAVSPSLKAYKIPGRARLFEVVEKVKQVNAERRYKLPKHQFEGSSVFADELESNPKLELDYIIAPPRMSMYMEYSTRIYNIYLKYVAPEDIHVYSIDEVFIDISQYAGIYHMTPRELTMGMIQDILQETGITATAGIGTNLYLCKIAMDIGAKHVKPDENGVRIASLNERTYREQLWSHRPLTDFWRVGRGYAKRLEEQGLYTMGDIARCSIGKSNDYYNEDLLYKMFGINAELLIDHAWGYEPCTIADIKAYKPSVNSISTGQVLPGPYDAQKGRLIVKEMTDLLVLDLVDKGLVTDQIVLNIGYDVENLMQQKDEDKSIRLDAGEITIDHYGRQVPKPAHGSINLDYATSSTKHIMDKTLELYDKIMNPAYTMRRLNVVANHVIDEKQWGDTGAGSDFEQLDLFTDYEKLQKERQEAAQAREKEKSVQQAILSIKKKYGKNALLKGMNFEDGATTIERNGQVGGHKA